MKLNKTQINALAYKFYKEIQIDLEKKGKEKKIKELEKFRNDYNLGVQLLKDNKFLHTININLDKNNYVSLSRNKSFEEYTKSYSFNYVIDKPKEIKISDIEQDIILATIDSQSVEDIMKILKTKYK